MKNRMTKLEKVFKKWERIHIKNNDDMPMYPEAFRSGWNACKKEVIKQLKESWEGLDRSVNTCDLYYIEKIEHL